MQPVPFSAREAFHLAFLRALAGRLPHRPWVLKGGVCLRLFLRSPRLSEDIDFDVAKLPVPTLASAVKASLSHPGFRATLRMEGIIRTSWTAPKQTATTQRWKVQLELEGGQTLPTRVEFSRREHHLEGIVQSVPDAALLQEHRIPAFVAPHYSVSGMIEKKLAALASPSRTAIRDLFDLHHLGRELGGRLPHGNAVPEAIEKIHSFQRSQFLADVAPFLPADLAALYGGKDGFESMRKEVLEWLTRP